MLLTGLKSSNTKAFPVVSPDHPSPVATTSPAIYLIVTSHQKIRRRHLGNVSLAAHANSQTIIATRQFEDSLAANRTVKTSRRKSCTRGGLCKPSGRQQQRLWLCAIEAVCPRLTSDLTIGQSEDQASVTPRGQPYVLAGRQNSREHHMERKTIPLAARDYAQLRVAPIKRGANLPAEPGRCAEVRILTAVTSFRAW